MAKPRVDVQVAADVAGAPRSAHVRRWARAALDGLGESGHLCIRIVGNDEMAELNRRFRNKAGTTNVLSFGADLVSPDGSERFLGDLVVCAPVVEREAAQQQKRAADHYAHLVVHGVLHLCGFDHERAADAQVMEGREVAILRGLGIDDPYRTHE